MNSQGASGRLQTQNLHANGGLRNDRGSLPVHIIGGGSSVRPMSQRNALTMPPPPPPPPPLLRSQSSHDASSRMQTTSQGRPTSGVAPYQQAPTQHQFGLSGPPAMALSQRAGIAAPPAVATSGPQAHVALTASMPPPPPPLSSNIVPAPHSSQQGHDSSQAHVSRNTLASAPLSGPMPAVADSAVPATMSSGARDKALHQGDTSMQLDSISYGGAESMDVLALRKELEALRQAKQALDAQLAREKAEIQRMTVKLAESEDHVFVADYELAQERQKLQAEVKRSAERQKLEMSSKQEENSVLQSRCNELNSKLRALQKELESKTNAAANEGKLREQVAAQQKMIEELKRTIPVSGAGSVAGSAASISARSPGRARGGAVSSTSSALSGHQIGPGASQQRLAPTALSASSTGPAGQTVPVPPAADSAAQASSVSVPVPAPVAVPPALMALVKHQRANKTHTAFVDKLNMVLQDEVTVLVHASPASRSGNVPESVTEAQLNMLASAIQGAQQVRDALSGFKAHQAGRAQLAALPEHVDSCASRAMRSVLVPLASEGRAFASVKPPANSLQADKSKDVQAIRASATVVAVSAGADTAMVLEDLTDGPSGSDFIQSKHEARKSMESPGPLNLWETQTGLRYLMEPQQGLVHPVLQLASRSLVHSLRDVQIGLSLSDSRPSVSSSNGTSHTNMDSGVSLQHSSNRRALATSLLQLSGLTAALPFTAVPPVLALAAVRVLVACWSDMFPTQTGMGSAEWADSVTDVLCSAAVLVPALGRAVAEASAAAGKPIVPGSRDASALQQFLSFEMAAALLSEWCTDVAQVVKAITITCTNSGANVHVEQHSVYTQPLSLVYGLSLSMRSCQRMLQACALAHPGRLASAVEIMTRTYGPLKRKPARQQDGSARQIPIIGGLPAATLDATLHPLLSRVEAHLLNLLPTVTTAATSSLEWYLGARQQEADSHLAPACTIVLASASALLETMAAGLVDVVDLGMPASPSALHLGVCISAVLQCIRQVCYSQGNTSLALLLATDLAASEALQKGNEGRRSNTSGNGGQGDSGTSETSGLMQAGNVLSESIVGTEEEEKLPLIPDLDACLLLYRVCVLCTILAETVTCAIERQGGKESWDPARRNALEELSHALSLGCEILTHLFAEWHTAIYSGRMSYTLASPLQMVAWTLIAAEKVTSSSGHAIPVRLPGTLIGAVKASSGPHMAAVEDMSHRFKARLMDHDRELQDLQQCIVTTSVSFTQASKGSGGLPASVVAASGALAAVAQLIQAATPS